MSYLTSMTRLLLFIIMLLLFSCQTVQPWQRGLLARPEMQLEPDRLQAKLHSQVYFSNEASSGDSEVAGAGCGCN